MLTAYKAVIKKEHALSTFGFGMFGRIPLAMNPVALVLLISETKDSFAIAGVASGAYTLTGAIFGPRIGRIADRIGSQKVLPPITIVNFLAVLMIINFRNGTEWQIALASALAGATFPNFGSYTRTRWSHSIENHKELNTALSIESVLDEIAFVAGPALAGVLFAVYAPHTPLVFGLFFLIVGGLGLGYSGAPHKFQEVHEEKHGGLLKISHFKPLLLSLVFMGCVFGGNTVATLAAAKEAGRTDGGILVALYSIGSLVAGTLYGLRHWKSKAGARYFVALIIMTLSTCGIVITQEIDHLAYWLILSGFAISPTLIAGNAFMTELVPANRLNESFSWLGAAISIGITIGSAANGWLVNQFNAWHGFYFVTGSSALAALCALLGVANRREQN
jgi:MFS family permease